MMSRLTIALHQPWARIVLTLMVSAALVFAFTQVALGADADGDCFDDATDQVIAGCVPGEVGGAAVGGADDDTLGVNIVQSNIKLGDKDIRETAATIINVALSLLGIIAVVVILIGGFFWMTAGGNEDQIGKAKGWIFSGIIGLAIILSAFAISKFVLEKLGSATGLGEGGL
jgi:hypothetical protein